MAESASDILNAVTLSDQLQSIIFVVLAYGLLQAPWLIAGVEFHWPKSWVERSEDTARRVGLTRI